MKLLAAALLPFVCVGLANAARILGFFPVPSISHQVVFRQLMLGLSRRGHDVTVITPNPIGANRSGYTEVDVSFVYRPTIYDFDVHKRRSPERFIWDLDRILLILADMELSHESVRRVIRDGSFDLVLVEFIHVPSIAAVAHVLRTPFIGVASLDLSPQMHDMVGNPYHPAYYPDILLPYTDRKDFLARARTFVTYLFRVVTYRCYWLPRHDEVARKHFGEDIPYVGDLERNVSMVFAYTDFTTGFPYPTTPAYLRIGGGKPMHIAELKPLPQDIQEFLDSAPEGVVYFSLGSNVKSEAMPESKRSVFVEAFKRIKQKVLWKWEADVLPGKPDNVKIGKWLPQTDILAHPNVRVFVTQGGLQSVTEATYNEVPMVVVPFFADQELNSKKLESVGVAIRVDYESLDLDTFLPALTEVLNNRGYKERMVKYAALTQDQPQSPLERAIWWTEYVIRHKGARHLRSAAVDMPWYQYFLLDVIAFILVVLFVFFYVLYVVLRCLKRLLFKGNKPKEE